MNVPPPSVPGVPHARPCRWIIWDWNGTLLDDTAAALDAFNAQLTARGCRKIALDFYRAHFAFPVKPFYALCGIDLAHEDWDRIAREYHAAYAREPKALNREAVAALERVKAAGVRQCVLSALRQDLLEAAIEEAGIRGYFDFVYGTDNLDGAGKMDRAHELMAQLYGRGRASRPATSDIVVIGDALHDREVADALGVRCVLCAQGGHCAERLRAVAPTGDTLLDAVALALRPQQT